jgi:hypothetical protein
MLVSQDPVEIEKHIIAESRLLAKIDNWQADVEQGSEENLSIIGNAVRGLSPQKMIGRTSCSASKSATYSFSLLMASKMTLWRFTSFSGSKARASSGTTLRRPHAAGSLGTCELDRDPGCTSWGVNIGPTKQQHNEG